MFDSEFYNTLSQLSLAMTHKSSMNMSGNRKSVQKGVSAEFSDFREYMPGDDLRRLDWNVYARLDRMYIREYMEEKEAVIMILLDTSASMDYGSNKKSELATMLAAVVAYIALSNMDRVVLIDTTDMMRPLSLGGGKKSFPRVIHWLENRRFAGESHLLEDVRKIPLHGSGVTVVISDFLQESLLEEENPSYEKMLQYLRYRKQRPVMLQTLAGEELHIDMEGTRNLIDMETDGKLRVTMDAQAIEAYEQELTLLTDRLKKGCAACGGAYVLCDTMRELKKLIYEDLRVLYDI